MENNNQLQEINPESKPILLQIIAVISIIFGIAYLFSVLFFVLPEFSSIGSIKIIFDLVRGIIMGFVLLAGGLGLLRMKKWGLYLFTIIALFLIIYALFNVRSVWLWFGVRGLITPIFIIIYGTGSFFYLWKIRNYFK